MNSVSVQIQRAISVPLVVRYQILPQIQNAIMVRSGHVTQKGWNVPAERPETNGEVLRNEKARNNSKSERVQNSLTDETTNQANDIKSFIFTNEA